VLTASTSILATLLGNGVCLDRVKVSIVDVSAQFVPDTQSNTVPLASRYDVMAS